MSQGVAPYALDPFGPSANPGAYVACQASERARAALERSFDMGRVAAIVGPPGNGKTLLLRLLGGREEERARVVYVPFCTLEEDDFYSVVLNGLGAPPRQADPRAAVLDLARSLSARGGIVILVDDAGAMSDACAESLAELCREGAGAVRVGLAAVEGTDASRVFRAFGDAIDIVRLSEGMSEREARRYVETRLAYGGARPELVAAFDDETVVALHRVSQGNPRRLNQAAENIVRRAMPGLTPRLREIAGVGEPTAPATIAPPQAPAPRQPIAPPQAPAPIAPQTPPPPPPAPPRAPAPPPTATERAAHLSVVADRKPKRAPIEVPAPLVVPPRAPPPPASADIPPPTAAEPPVPPAGAPSPPPARPPQPPRPAATPAPAEPRTPKDTGGILLPHAFEDGPGEYRLVGGRFVDPATGRPPGEIVVEPAIEVPPPAPPVVRRRGLEERTESLRRKAAEQPAPAPQRELPIRTLGLIGFILGLGGAYYWMSQEPKPAFQTDPPSVPSFAEEPAAPTPTPTAAPKAPTTTPRAPSPAPKPSVVATPSVPAPPTTPVPTPGEGATLPPLSPAEAAAPVRVSINATPWAVIEVDGRVLGETPLAGVMLSPGVHTFHAIMPDGTTRERAVEIHEGNRTVVFQ